MTLESAQLTNWCCCCLQRFQPKMDGWIHEPGLDLRVSSQAGTNDEGHIIPIDPVDQIELGIGCSFRMKRPVRLRTLCLEAEECVLSDLLRRRMNSYWLYIGSDCYWGGPRRTRVWAPCPQVAVLAKQSVLVLWTAHKDLEDHRLLDPASTFLGESLPRVLRDRVTAPPTVTAGRYHSFWAQENILTALG